MAEEAAVEEPKKKGKKLFIILPAVVVMLGIGVAGYMLTAGKGSSKAAAAGAPTTTTTIALGKIVRLTPITMNLSDGHVLKVGIALQTVEKPKGKELKAILAAQTGEGAKIDATSPLSGQEAIALDQAINDLGNSTMTELQKPGGRAAAKAELANKITELYEGDITEVYFTDFVMS